MRDPVRAAVEVFRRIGARCRKKPRMNEYVCWLGDARAEVSGRGIKVFSQPGEVRMEVLILSTSDGLDEDKFLRRLEEATGAESAWIMITKIPEAYVALEFRLEDAEKAAKALKALAEHDMWVAVTNMKGELRLYKDGEAVGTQEWLRAFE